jgi:hypothetical protein
MVPLLHWVQDEQQQQPKKKACHSPFHNRPGLYWEWTSKGLSTVWEEANDM